MSKTAMIKSRILEGDIISGQWCIDGDTRDNIAARRNVLAGLWAGRQMRMTDRDLTNYAAEVHLADFTVPGEADLIEKLYADLTRHGIVTTRQAVCLKLAELHRQALAQTCATD